MADDPNGTEDVALQLAQTRSRFVALREISDLWGEHVRVVSDAWRKLQVHPGTPPETMVAVQAVADITGRSIAAASARMLDLVEELGVEFQRISQETDPPELLR